MTKPIITVKQSSHVTTVKLKGVPFAYVIATNKDIAAHGLIGVIENKMESCKAKGYKLTLAKYEMLLGALLGASKTPNYSSNPKGA